jgi:hypothetical protein
MLRVLLAEKGWVQFRETGPACVRLCRVGRSYQNEGPGKSVPVFGELAEKVRHDGCNCYARNKLCAAYDVEREERVVRGLHAIFTRHDAENHGSGRCRRNKGALVGVNPCGEQRLAM